MIKIPQIIGETWLNTAHPVTPEELNGRVVLVDFFSYSCVNCIRTIPYLKKIWDRYKHLNFFLIGIHTPEFEFEKDGENVGTALVDLGVNWPIVLDNEYVNWNNFANHYWPAEYLTDQDGFVVYEHFGEGGYENLERKIQELLDKDFGDKSLPAILPERIGESCVKPTPETYCGYRRGKIINEGGYHLDHIANYIKPKMILPNSVALSGQFEATPEYVESLVDSSTLFIDFVGTEVNLVIEPSDDLAIIELKIDDEDLPREAMGIDVDQGDVIVTRPRMYNLIKSKKPISGILSIKAKESNFRAYAFTFSGCSE